MLRGSPVFSYEQLASACSQRAEAPIACRSRGHEVIVRRQQQFAASPLECVCLMLHMRGAPEHHQVILAIYLLHLDRKCFWFAP